MTNEQALAYHTLFQACIAKRPYNLFHRKNLYMRLANVKRNFGNKRTWDVPFDKSFLRFSNEISNKIFSNGKENSAKCTNILKNKKKDYDMVYLDPPYIKSKHDMPIDYYRMYHFLEGIIKYNDWERNIDHSRKNKPLLKKNLFWSKSLVETNFDKIFNKFQDSIIVISYGDPGYPSIESIIELLLNYKKNIVIRKKEYTYALNHSSKNGNKSFEALIIAK